MSHCTTFDFAFKDKKTLFKALKILGYKPENQVWSEFSNKFHKKTAIMPLKTKKYLTGTHKELFVFFDETDNGFVPTFESDSLSEYILKEKSKHILDSIKTEYVKISVNNYVQKLNQTGLSAIVEEIVDHNQISFKLYIGTLEKSIEIQVNNNFEITETVSGVQGDSCVKLTESLESQISNNVNRVWTHEYSTFIQDQEIQVLKLNH